jgi:dihydropteroate synthase
VCSSDLDVLADLQTSIDAMRSAGVDAGQIWTDPGFGFAKDAAQNLEVLKNLSQLVALGYPVLLGTSRKSTIGRVLKKQIPTDREDGTAATLVWGIQQGARMVRVHDVAAMRPFVQMADAIRAGITWKERASQQPV